jgi:phosphopantetheine adenylyltransferase
MNYLYSLYDALVSISVPSDKARAVVDAMERDMSTALATKQDLQLLRQEVTAFRTELKQDLASVRTELKQEIESRYTLQDQKIDSVRSDLTREIGTLRGDVARDMAALELRLTIKLGSMFFVAFGLLIAALRVWE